MIRFFCFIVFCSNEILFLKTRKKRKKKLILNAQISPKMEKKREKVKWRSCCKNVNSSFQLSEFHKTAFIFSFRSSDWFYPNRNNAYTAASAWNPNRNKIWKQSPLKRLRFGLIVCVCICMVVIMVFKMKFWTVHSF